MVWGDVSDDDRDDASFCVSIVSKFFLSCYREQDNFLIMKTLTGTKLVAVPGVKDVWFDCPAAGHSPNNDGLVGEDWGCMPKKKEN